MLNTYQGKMRREWVGWSFFMIGISSLPVRGMKKEVLANLKCDNGVRLYFFSPQGLLLRITQKNHSCAIRKDGLEQ